MSYFTTTACPDQPRPDHNRVTDHWPWCTHCGLPTAGLTGGGEPCCCDCWELGATHPAPADELAETVEDLDDATADLLFSRFHWANSLGVPYWWVNLFGFGHDAGAN